MNINVDKGKELEIRKDRKANKEKVKRIREILEEAMKFRSLGVIINTDGNMEEEGSRRLHDGRKIWVMLGKCLMKNAIF